MPYATPEDVLAAWPRMHTAGIDHDEWRELIDRAGALIDATLARRYTVPFTGEPNDAPPIIRRLVCDLALLDVFDRSPNTPDWIVRRLERASEILDALLKGDLLVVGADGSTLAERTDIGTITSTTSGYTPVFGGVKSLDERDDPTRRSDEAATRGFGTGTYDEDA